MRKKDAVEILLKNNSWADIISRKPLFANLCDQWEKFYAEDWVRILQFQPQFADKCNKWAEFDEDDKEALLDAQPQLAKYFNDSHN